jgi:hypothetical protein
MLSFFSILVYGRAAAFIRSETTMLYDVKITILPWPCWHVAYMPLAYVEGLGDEADQCTNLRGTLFSIIAFVFLRTTFPGRYSIGIYQGEREEMRIGEFVK